MRDAISAAGAAELCPCRGRNLVAHGSQGSKATLGWTPKPLPGL